MKYISKKAFDLGFKAFREGTMYDSPYDKDDIHYKEWLRGIDFAYNMILKRNKVRESYNK